MSIKGFEVGGVQQQYDYTALDNIPANLVQDANYVHTDNNYTNADKTKLSGIEAQANKTTIDATLTHSGQAADAKATGDAISALNAQVIASIPHDTASGSIANFPDGAAMPVIDCSVAVAPNQNLHGYANPWPGGGGKNLAYLEQGSINTLNGVEILSTTRVRTQYIPVIEGQKYIASSQNNLWSVRNGCTYDASKNFIEANIYPSISTGEITIPTGVAFLRLVYSHVDTAEECAPSDYWYQFELGNQATSYAPYSNICPISG